MPPTSGRLTPGLVSISFRPLTPERILSEAKAAGLQAIEWGGDIHCPHGDVARASAVGEATRQQGLTVAAYGSYYRLGKSEADGLSFASVVASAVALQAPLIRVWVGWKGSADTTAAERQAIIADGRRCAALAAAAGLVIVVEWHGNTLTDTLESGRDVLQSVGHPAFQAVWQPSVGLTTEQALAELTGILPWVRHLHVFHWQVRDRLPLAEGVTPWRRYLACAAGTGRPMTAALEFVLGDAVDQLHRDAATLHTLLNELP